MGHLVFLRCPGPISGRSFGRGTASDGPSLKKGSKKRAGNARERPGPGSSGSGLGTSVDVIDLIFKGNFDGSYRTELRSIRKSAIDKPTIRGLRYPVELILERLGSGPEHRIERSRILSCR